MWQGYRTTGGGRDPAFIGSIRKLSRTNGSRPGGQDLPATIAAGQLAVDTDGADPIGLLVHVTRANVSAANPPEGGWFGRRTEARVPATFPIGLASEVPDREFEHFRNRLLGRRAPEPERPIAGEVVGIMEAWTGDTLTLVDGGAVTIPPTELFLLHWMAALTSDSTPRFELWIEPNGEWTAPAATPDYAVMSERPG